MGKVACAYENSRVESCFDSMQIGLLDRGTWPTRAERITAIFEWIDTFTARSAGNPATATSARRSRTSSHRRLSCGITTTPNRPENRGPVRRYQAVLAVIADSRTITEPGPVNDRCNWSLA